MFLRWQQSGGRSSHLTRASGSSSNSASSSACAAAPSRAATGSGVFRARPMRARLALCPRFEIYGAGLIGRVRSAKIRRSTWQADARAAAVLIDELDACAFEGLSDHNPRCRARRCFFSLELPNCNDPNACISRELLLRPCQQASRASTLRSGDRAHYDLKTTHMIKIG